MQEIWITRDKALDCNVLGWPSEPKCDCGEWYNTDYYPIILVGELFKEVTFENSPMKAIVSIDKENISLNEYQQRIQSTEHWPKDLGPIYPALGLTGEAGEVANDIKKFTKTSDNKDTTCLRLYINCHKLHNFIVFFIVKHKLFY